MTFRIATRKVIKERGWSMAIVGLLTVGLTSWIVVPSISASLQQGLSSYGNSTATYIFVYDMGSPDGSEYRIPTTVNDEITAIPGVQAVYPIVSNRTYFFNVVTFHFRLPNGSYTNNPNSTASFQSAVIGGQGGFPQALISVSEGRLPEAEAGFIVNGLTASTLKLNHTFITGFMVPFEKESPTDYIDSSGKYLQFNATAVGQMPYNPMLQQIDVLWNSTFLNEKLGAQVYAQTFGGDGANLFIIKAKDISQVEQVANKLQSIFADYSGYSVIYDQATVNAQLSFQSNSRFLYDLIGITSLFSVVSLIFLFTYVFTGRRRWEAGLLITQGWSWRGISKLLLYYYVVLGIAAVTISLPISSLIGSQFGYSFQVYGRTLVIPITIEPYMLASSVAIALVVSCVAAYFAVWRMKRIGLDNLLREY